MFGQPNYMNYYQPQYQPVYQPQRTQPMQQTVQPVQQPVQQGLQGKSVDSIEVVKAMDIPLDGSISYFPLTDGSLIVTKQLQQDGTSKTLVYKQVEEKEAGIEKNNYVTNESLEKALKNIDTTSLREEFKTMKRQIKDIFNDIEDLKDRKD